MRKVVVALLLLVFGMPVAVYAEGPVNQEVPPPEPADTTPTAFACSAATFKTGEPCTFEFDAQPSADPATQATANRRVVTEMMAKECDSAAKAANAAAPDPAVKAICLQDAAEQVEGCVLEGSVPLLDAEGNFAVAAKPCYLALSEVIRKTRLMVATTVACCRCAVKNGCTTKAQDCHRNLLLPSPRLSPCSASSCQSECAAFIPPPPETDPSPPGVRSTNIEFL